MSMLAVSIVWDHPRIPHDLLPVMLCLGENCSPDFWGRMPNLERLGRRIRLSPEEVKNKLRQCRDLGLISFLRPLEGPNEFDVPAFMIHQNSDLPEEVS